MKSPEELRRILIRQWARPVLRESRLLGGEHAWPILMPIGCPAPSRIRSAFDAVKRHIECWRQVKCGEVQWESVSYRATASRIDVPTSWKLHQPSEWVEACHDPAVCREFDMLSQLAEQTDSIFHSLFVRRRSLWREKPVTEIVLAARIALLIEPGMASGSPLRALSIEGIDTKFFERHESLVTALLDVRFDGEVSAVGLEAFLGAVSDGDHWLLVIDLDGSLMPFRSQRVRSSELRAKVLPGHRLLIVENESCQHHLPQVSDTIAVLGAGFNLSWTSNPTLSGKRVAYWGDIDTWGMHCLSIARQSLGHLVALMMNADVFAQYNHVAVCEPVPANPKVPVSLTQAEGILYQQLLQSSRGRLEQEFLPEQFVHNCILHWAANDV